jgi:hypothetical protein
VSRENPQMEKMSVIHPLIYENQASYVVEEGTSTVENESCANQLL